MEDPGRCPRQATDFALVGHYAAAELATGGRDMHLAIGSDIHGNLTTLEAVIADISVSPSHGPGMRGRG
jgi:hypothetical protein